MVVYVFFHGGVMNVTMGGRTVLSGGIDGIELLHSKYCNFQIALFSKWHSRGHFVIGLGRWVKKMS